ncbi:hypothetical protein TWF788_000824 [Orbilia oligospora]|uniref:CMP/dCMP-type deaminase domain-containing protein n=1 Tax=Orbilia oligospora TaxID=2813651 RepID=A0A7C8PG67_ORBOL|nr:hypothetical protein TWF788_000824 [Orbilia oligospora]
MQPEAPHEASMLQPVDFDDDDPRFFMQLALDEAKKCIPSQTAFSVGAVLVDNTVRPYKILATGFSRELEGNTHAEEVCFTKLMKETPLPGYEKEYTIYTTMEPCSERLSGKKPCVDRIIDFGRVSTVYVGCQEPSTFVTENTATSKLAERGIRYLLVDGMGSECRNVATKGHLDSPSGTDFK